MWAIDARTGSKLFHYKAGGPILHSAGAVDDKIIFACMDGCVYAIKAENGDFVWKFESGLDTGFSTAVALGDEKVFVVNRGGVVYALKQSSGEQVWKKELGVPLLQSPAYLPKTADKPGTLFFGGMDMKVYALDGETGDIRWKTERLYGQAFKDYWPVVHKGKVVVRSFIAYPKPLITMRYRTYKPVNFPLTWADPFPPQSWYPDEEKWKVVNEQATWLREHTDEIAAGKMPEEIMAAQQRVVEEYKQNPQGMDMFVMDAASGQQKIVPHWCAQTMNGATSSPVVDRDGMLIVPIMFINSRWARLDLDKGEVVDILYDGYTERGQKVTELTKPDYHVMAGGGNTDENMVAASAGDMVFSFHTQESNANYTGVWDMINRRWSPIAGMVWGEMTSNTQGGGASPQFVADGILYHMTFHSIRAWKPASIEGGAQ
jgi:outer membrane protein assembly factor BamB